MNNHTETKEIGFDSGDEVHLVSMSPLHEANGANQCHEHEHDTIRKPPPTVHQNLNTTTKRRKAIAISSSSSIRGGEACHLININRSSDNDNSNSSSSSKKDGSNAGTTTTSSGPTIVTATGHSNSSSGDDKASTYNGSNSANEDSGGRPNRSNIEHSHSHSHSHSHKNKQGRQERRTDHPPIEGMHVQHHHSYQQDSHIQTSPTTINGQGKTCATQDIEASHIRNIMATDNPIRYNQEHNTKKSPSANGSDGGYEASASSNDDGYENTSSTSENASSSSHITDFSSGSDSGDVNPQSPQRAASRSQISFSSSDDSEGSLDGTRKESPKKVLNCHSAVAPRKKETAKRRASSIPQTSSTVAKRRKRCPRSDHKGPDSQIISKKKQIVGTKTVGLPDAFDQEHTHTEFKIPSSWDFIERNLKKKVSTLGKLCRKSSSRTTYSSTNDIAHLQHNFDLAMKRHTASESSSSNIEKSLASLHANNTYNMRFDKTPIHNVGVDAMANILSYLKPVEAYRTLSAPLSKAFRQSFSKPQDVWKILCFSEPFHAALDYKKNKGSGDESSSSYPMCNDIEVRHILGRYRLLFTSFVRCVTYLDRIKNDTLCARAQQQSDQNYQNNASNPNNNSSLEQFFARARQAERSDSYSDLSSSSCSNESELNKQVQPEKEERKPYNENEKAKNIPKVKYGSSSLTKRLLGPVHHRGIAGYVDLPRSCAVYSIANWMVAFADVAGIQTMCLRVLPLVLEEDSERVTAQNAGLTDIILRAMVLFPDRVDLHTCAFHTLVLLARPIGGREGMIFYRAMVNASGIFNIGSSTGKSGIAIMMDSLKRFSANEELQAMSCWSMVNIALIQSQKQVLVRLGGISAAGNAMSQHPTSPEVQFRALFALINLVIPSENLPENSSEAQEVNQQVDGVNQNSEIDMLDESVDYITHLVVVAMKRFCTNTAILNRACLVLHNLSLNPRYHEVILWTPNCYQMIEWCIENYAEDKVLQQSARGALQRLQITLSSNEALRTKFAETIRAQQLNRVNNASRSGNALDSRPGLPNEE